MTGAITIRSSTEADAPAIRDLALLDGGAAPRGDALLAYVDGELRVAVGRTDGAAVADPFHLTADIVTLVRAAGGSGAAARHHGVPGWLVAAGAGDPRGGEGMNPTLDQLVASARADELRWLERTASDRPGRRFRRVQRRPPRSRRAERCGSGAPMGGAPAGGSGTSFRTRSKTSSARSRCSRSCVAITLVRSSAPPRWTAG